jgi:hypothetical protein
MKKSAVLEDFIFDVIVCSCFFVFDIVIEFFFPVVKLGQVCLCFIYQEEYISDLVGVYANHVNYLFLVTYRKIQKKNTKYLKRILTNTEVA